MDIFPPLSELLQLSTLPSGEKGTLPFDEQALNSPLGIINQVADLIGFRLLLAALMFFDTSLVIFFEYLIRRWNC